MSKLDDVFGQSIQVTRIGRATDPKPENKIWFTTQMQDLFTLELGYTKQLIKDLMYTVYDEDYKIFKKNLEQL